MTATLTARSSFIASPRRPRWFWRKPWWWRIRLYWMAPPSASRRERRQVLDAVLICRGILPEPVS